MMSNRRNRRLGAYVLLGLGFIAVVSAPVVWLAGDQLLRVIRGREIAAEAARTILPKLLLLAGATIAFAGCLLASSGRLLLLRGDGVEGVAACKDACGHTRGPGHRVASVSILLFAAAFGGAQLWLAGRSLSYDEILAVEADVRAPLVKGLSPRAWINHVSGSLLARGSRVFLGESERGLRSASVLLGSVAIAGIGFWVLRVSGSGVAAVWLAAALGSNALVLEMSPQIRGYSPMMWFGAATVLWTTSLLLPAERKSSRVADGVAFFGLLACAVLLGMSHLFGLVYLVAFSSLVHGYLWMRRETTCNGAIPAASLAVGTAVSLALSAPAFPWLFYMTGGGKTDTDLGRVQRELSVLFLGRDGSTVLVWGVLGCLVLCSIVLWSKSRGLAPLILASTAPLAGVLAAVFLTRPSFFYARFLLLSLVLASVTIALGVAGFFRSLGRQARALAAVALFIGTLASLAPSWIDRLTDTWGYREAVQSVTLVAQRFGAKDVKVLPVGDWNSTTILRYYLDTKSLAPESLVDLPLRKSGRGATVVAVLVGEEKDWTSVEQRLEPVSRPSWRAEIRGARNCSLLQLRGLSVP